jgi:hypothetical protein
MLLPDTYSFQARFVPMLVVVLPAAVLLGAGIISTARLGVALGAVLTVASAIFSQLGRDRGKQLEAGLWDSWGGAPTLQRLRYAGATESGSIDRLHARIANVLGDPLPTAEAEASDPAAADRRYSEATRRLIARTTDHNRFPLVYAENINYGMRRNLLGLRSPGILMAGLTALAGFLLVLLAGGNLEQRTGRYVPALGVAIVELAFWIAIVSPNWVRPTADAYADRLMESLELLHDIGAARSDQGV